MKAHESDSGPVFRLFQLAGLTLVSLLLFSLLTVLVAGGDLESIRSLKLAQLLQSIGIFFVPPLVLASVWSHRPAAWLKLTQVPSAKKGLLVLLTMWSAIPAINLIGEWNDSIVLPGSLATLEAAMRAMEQRAEEMTERLMVMEDWVALLSTLGLVAVIPALGEELFFRATVQQLLHSKVGKHLAVWLAAVIFSFIHFQFYGFVPRMLLGAIMGYLMVWSGSLWYPVIAHFVNNATVVSFYFMHQQGWVDLDLERFGSDTTALAGYISIVVCTVMMLVVKKQFDTPTPGGEGEVR
ncbi:MAG: hypothetical protein BGP01_13685 [Paludibacter sp. 47-17]|nr:MAG: hypothetical protein ABS72_02655 [Paludibacter sp. SCN 50-10]OJX87731.1 MAG: hypothetical protein BGP01_13685 [Paludibacter sp. 47-17]